MRISDWSSDVCSSDLFADVVPELAPLKYLRTPLGGSLILHLNENGEQVDLGFDLKAGAGTIVIPDQRSEEHTSELQSLMRISYAVFCLKKKKTHTHLTQLTHHVIIQDLQMTIS